MKLKFKDLHKTIENTYNIQINNDILTLKVRMNSKYLNGI